MDKLNVYVFWLFIILSVNSWGLNGQKPNTAETWTMQDQCGRQLHSYGGVINFDAMRMKTQRCTVTLVGKGANDTMLSLYFTKFNVSDGCHANVTIKEPAAVNPVMTFQSKGLYLTYCKSSRYLNENLMFTTDHNIVTVTVDGSHSRIPSDLMFTLKFASYTSRVHGCEQKETEDGMFSCPSGRCVHTSVLCKDLNPCGDQRDCNVTSLEHGVDDVGSGMNYINFVVIFIVVVFAVFALIQISLIVRSEKPLCSKKDETFRFEDDTRLHIEAEIMPMKHDRRIEDYQIEDDRKS